MQKKNSQKNGKHLNLPRHPIPIANKFEQCFWEEFADIGCSDEHKRNTNKREYNSKYFANIRVHRYLTITWKKTRICTEYFVLDWRSPVTILD